MKDFGLELMNYDTDTNGGKFVSRVVEEALKDKTMRLAGYDGFINKNSDIEKVVIIHHNDLDGFASAANVADIALTNINGCSVELHSVDYLTAFDIEWFKPFDTTEVWMVDYSLSNIDNLNMVLNLPEVSKKHLVWIDHHQTSMEIKEPGICEINGFVGDYKLSSAVQVEIYLQALYEFIEPMGSYSSIPPFLRYVSDWDTFSHAKRANGKETIRFKYGVQAVWKKDFAEIITNRHISKQWKMALWEDRRTSSIMIQDLIRTGDMIYQYVESENARTQAMGTDLTFKFGGETYSVRAVNSRGNSLSFGDYYDTRDLCCMFFYDMKRDVYTYSIYSKYMDGSKISKFFGGGGHPGASGFSLKINMFKQTYTDDAGSKILDLNFINTLINISGKEA